MTIADKFGVLLSILFTQYDLKVITLYQFLILEALLEVWMWLQSEGFDCGDDDVQDVNDVDNHDEDRDDKEWWWWWWIDHDIK